MSQSDSGAKTWWVFAGLVVIAAVVLLPGQRTSLVGALPFLFLLACPLLHRFAHGGHGARGSHRHGNRDSVASSSQEGTARDLDRLTRNHSDL